MFYFVSANFFHVVYCVNLQISVRESFDANSKRTPRTALVGDLISVLILQIDKHYYTLIDR